jgi:hypothetical protein
MSGSAGSVGWNAVDSPGSDRFPDCCARNVTQPAAFKGAMHAPPSTVNGTVAGRRIARWVL